MFSSKIIKLTMESDIKYLMGGAGKDTVIGRRGSERGRERGITTVDWG